MKIKSKVVAITLGLSCSLPLVAVAEPVASNPSVKVNFADLNLSNDADVANLYSRLNRGAERSCGKRVSKPVQRVIAHKACVKAALSDAVAQVNNEQLASLHGGSSYQQMVSQSDE